MRKITKISGRAIPLAMNDVDTDMIIPAQYLTATSRDGYGEFLFKRLRENQKDFVFNLPKFKRCNLLIAQSNFGCGSSREHAVWSLQQAGIEVVIASSFADIFYSNSAKNGLLLITLSKAAIEEMFALSSSGNGEWMIDLEAQTIKSSISNISYSFEFDPFRKYCLMEGLDDLDYLISHQGEIDAWVGEMQ